MKSKVWVDEDAYKKLSVNIKRVYFKILTFFTVQIYKALELPKWGTKNSISL